MAVLWQTWALLDLSIELGTSYLVYMLHTRNVPGPLGSPIRRISYRTFSVAGVKCKYEKGMINTITDVSRDPWAGNF